MNSTNLHLVLKSHWFAETRAGRKRIEYRVMSENWAKRIWAKRDQIKTVTFSRGFTKNQIRFVVTLIDIGPCPIPGWSGDFYRIHFTDESK